VNHPCGNTSAVGEDGACPEGCVAERNTLSGVSIQNEQQLLRKKNVDMDSFTNQTLAFHNFVSSSSPFFHDHFIKE
jgi:hypothetical protein